MSGKANSFQERLGQVLVESGFLVEEQLDQARQEASRNGTTLVHVLWEKRFITREVLVSALAFQFKIPVVDLSQTAIDPKAVELFSRLFGPEYPPGPEGFCIERHLVPFGFGDNDDLKLAMENPQDFEAINALLAMGHRVKPHILVGVGIKEAIAIVFLKKESLLAKTRALMEECRRIRFSAQQKLVRSIPATIPQSYKDTEFPEIIAALLSAKVIFRGYTVRVLRRHGFDSVEHFKQEMERLRTAWAGEVEIGVKVKGTKVFVEFKVAGS